MGGQDFSQCQGKRICAMYPKGSDIPPSSPSSPCFWLDLRVACSYIPSRHLPSLRLAHMWPCDGSSSAGRRIYSPHASDPIIAYPFSNKSPKLVNSDPGVLNCPFPKYSNLDYYAATRRNGCATFEFLKFWKSSLIFFFFSGIKTTVRKTD